MPNYIDELAVKIYAEFDTLSFDKGLKELASRLDYLHKKWNNDLTGSTSQQLAWIQRKANEVKTLYKGFRDSPNWLAMDGNEKERINRAYSVAMDFERRITQEIKNRKKLKEQTAKQEIRALKEQERIQKRRDDRHAKAIGQDIERTKRLAKQKESANYIANRGAGFAAISFLSASAYKIFGTIQSGIKAAIKENSELFKISKQIGVDPQKIQVWGRAIEVLGGDQLKFIDTIQKLNQKLAKINILDKQQGKDKGKGKSIATRELSNILKIINVNIKDEKGELKDAFALLDEIQKKTSKLKKNEQQGILSSLGIDEATQRLMMSDNFSEMLELYKKYASTQKEVIAGGNIDKQINTNKIAFEKYFSVLTKRLEPAIMSIAKKLQDETDKAIEKPVWTLGKGTAALAIVTNGIAMLVKAGGGIWGSMAKVGGFIGSGGFLAGIAAITAVLELINNWDEYKKTGEERRKNKENIRGDIVKGYGDNLHDAFVAMNGGLRTNNNIKAPFESQAAALNQWKTAAQTASEQMKQMMAASRYIAGVKPNLKQDVNVIFNGGINIDTENMSTIGSDAASAIIHNLDKAVGEYSAWSSIATGAGTGIAGTY